MVSSRKAGFKAQVGTAKVSPEQIPIIPSTEPFVAQRAKAKQQ
jgi:hypothetical protein